MTPTYEVYDEKFYIRINEENELVVKFLNNLNEKKKNFIKIEFNSEINRILENSVEEAINSLYNKVMEKRKILDEIIMENKKKLIDINNNNCNNVEDNNCNNNNYSSIDEDIEEDDDVNELFKIAHIIDKESFSKFEENSIINLLEMNSDERKILLIASYIKIISDSEKNLITINDIKETMDEAMIKKLSECSMFIPYYKYDIYILSKYVKNNDRYNSYFNYEDLTKMNVCLYTNSLFKNTDIINSELLIKLRTIVDNFRFSGLYKTNEELYKRFYELKKKFPEDEL
eukprot:jgi/Orpsp1_1/1181877/evm.model.c7180000078961.1